MANVAPTLDLNGSDAGTSTTVSYTESDPDAVLAPAATVADPGSPDFFGGSLIVEITSGAGTGDQIRIVMGAFTVEEGSLYYNNVPNGARIGSISGGSEGAPLTILFDQEVTEENGTQVTLAIVEELMRAVRLCQFLGDASGGNAHRHLHAFRRRRRHQRPGGVRGDPDRDRRPGGRPGRPVHGGRECRAHRPPVHQQRLRT